MQRYFVTGLGGISYDDALDKLKRCGRVDTFTVATDRSGTHRGFGFVNGLFNKRVPFSIQYDGGRIDVKKAIPADEVAKQRENQNEKLEIEESQPLAILFEGVVAPISSYHSSVLAGELVPMTRFRLVEEVS